MWKSYFLQLCLDFAAKIKGLVNSSFYSPIHWKKGSIALNKHRWEADEERAAEIHIHAAKQHGRQMHL